MGKNSNVGTQCTESPIFAFYVDIDDVDIIFDSNYYHNYFLKSPETVEEDAEMDPKDHRNR